MSQSLSRVFLHIVFSTKERYPFLKDRSLRSEMHAYLAGLGKTLDLAPVEIGGVADHVHLLVILPRTQSISSCIKEVKRNSSVWAKQKGLEKFAWQTGYGVFSVSQSNVPNVVKYIKKQEEHHRGLSFQDEYKLLLQKHAVDYDECYLWD